MACRIIGEPIFSGPQFLPARRSGAAHEESLHELAYKERRSSNRTPSALKSCKSNGYVVGGSSMYSGFALQKVMPTKLPFISIRNSLAAMSGTHTIISGYWVGPDIDDGCGYVEAMLDRIA